MLEKNFFIVKIVNLLLIGFAILFFAAFFLGHSSLSDNATIVLDLILTSTLLFFNTVKKNHRSSVGIFVAIMFCIFVFPRLISYIYIPDLISLPFPAKVDVRTINKGLLLLTLSTLMLYGGFYSAKLFNKKETLKIKNFSFSPFSIFFVGSLIFILDSSLNYFFTKSYLISSPKSEFNSILQIIKAFVSFDTFFFAILCFILLRRSPIENKNLSSLYFKLIIFFFILLEVYCFFSGSRGGFVRVLIELFAIFIVLKNNFFYKENAAILTIIVLIFLSLITFPIANSIRNKIVLPNEILLPNALLDRSVLEPRIFAKSENYRNTKLIFDRLGIVDYAILIPFSAYDREKMDYFVNFKYLVKSTINTFLPGVIFTEAPLPISRAINSIFRGYSIDFPLKNGYFSEYWTSFALLFLMFGFLTLPMHFALGFLMEYFYLLIENSRFLYNQFYSALYLFTIPFLVIFTMGFEHTLLTITVVLFQFYFSLISIVFFTNQFMNIRKYIRS